MLMFAGCAGKSIIRNEQRQQSSHLPELRPDTVVEVGSNGSMSQLGSSPHRPVRSLVVTELANTGRHKNQFLAVFHPSWKLMSGSRHQGKYTVDLMAFCEPDACSIIPKECKKVRGGEAPEAHGLGKCFYQVLGNSYMKPQYKYGLSINFMTTAEFAKIVGNYDYVMRSDVDAVLMPGLRHWVPEFGSAVGKGFMGSNFTERRLVGISRKLGLKHHGIHGMQSTFYIRANKIVPFSRMLVNLSKHFFEEEFTSDICAEVESKVGGHCAWPDWYQQVSTLYATDLAANHLLGEPDFKNAQVTEKLDHCSTSCWSDSARTFGHLEISDLSAKEIGQVHLVATKGWLGNDFLEQEDSGQFCELASKTWPDFKIDTHTHGDASGASANTFFMQVLAQSLPSMCKSERKLHA